MNLFGVCDMFSHSTVPALTKIFWLQLYAISHAWDWGIIQIDKAPWGNVYSFFQQCSWNGQVIGKERYVDKTWGHLSKGHLILKHRARAETVAHLLDTLLPEGSAHCSPESIIQAKKLKKILETQISQWWNWKFSFIQDNLLGQAKWLSLTGLEIAILLPTCLPVVCPKESTLNLLPQRLIHNY